MGVCGTEVEVELGLLIRRVLFWYLIVFLVLDIVFFTQFIECFTLYSILLIIFFCRAGGIGVLEGFFQGREGVQGRISGKYFEVRREKWGGEEDRVQCFFVFFWLGILGSFRFFSQSSYYGEGIGYVVLVKGVGIMQRIQLEF